MITFGSVLSKILIIVTFLIVAICFIIFPIFPWGFAFKKNIVIIITLIANKDLFTSSFFSHLLNSNDIVIYSSITLLLFNLSYWLPLIFIKDNYKKIWLAVYMFIITTLLLFFCFTIFNFFNIVNFENIVVTKWLITPWVAIALNLVAIFWYGLRILWLNNNSQILSPPLFTATEKLENKNETNIDYQELKMQLKLLKNRLKELKKNK